MGLQKQEKKVCLQLEALEDRLAPAVDAFIWRAGILTITPPAVQVSPHTTEINRQVGEFTLPSGDVLPGHGLKTADGHTPVVVWRPT